jgi:hypothetical protein
MSGHCNQCGWTACECPPNSEASAALDLAHVEQIADALDRLEQLELRASEGPWREGKWGGSVVNNEPARDVEIEGYGGNCILESARLADREFIIAIREHAGTLIRQAKNWKKTFAELDDVHAALGSDYEQHAGNLVRELIRQLKETRAALETSRAIREEIRKAYNV